MKPCQGSLFNIGEQEVEQFPWGNDVRKYLLSQNLPVRWITEVVDKDAFRSVCQGHREKFSSFLCGQVIFQ